MRSVIATTPEKTTHHSLQQTLHNPGTLTPQKKEFPQDKRPQDWMDYENYDSKMAYEKSPEIWNQMKINIT